MKIAYDNYDPDAAVISAALVRGEIISSRSLTHDILELRVLLDEHIQYRAGQYAELSVPELGVRRSYSFAEAPAAGGSRDLCFHVRHVPGGLMSGWLHAADRTGAELRVTAPYGDFWLRQADAPILCVAGGSGMAPVKAVLEHALTRGCERPVTFFFGARTQADIYCVEEMAHLRDAWRAPFRFVPVLSNEPAASDWTGQRGLVTDSLRMLGNGLADHHAYLCGPPAMIDAAIGTLQTAGTGAEKILYDKFLDARDLGEASALAV